MNKKKLLIYAHYYYPDVASTGQILQELAEGMIDTFEITVICVVPSYTGAVDEKYKNEKYYFESINGVNIIRVRVPSFSKVSKKSRVKNIMAYFLRAIYATFKCGKHDYVFSISQPPILGGLLGVIGKWIKNAKFIYNIQDFNPEQVMAVEYSKNRLLLKIMLFIDKFSCRHSNKVIVVGRDMVETLKKRFNYKNVPVNTFINNWIDEKAIYPLSRDNEKVNGFKKKYGLDNKLVIMYSGNIGLYYDLENILKVIGKFKDNNEVVFAFIGDGSIKNKLIQYKNNQMLENIVFIPYQRKEELIYSLNAADIHWVVNAKGIKGISVPSKIYGVMAVGKPIIGLLEIDSEARVIIEDSKCGFVITPGNYKEMEVLIDFCIKVENRETLDKMGKLARNYLVNKLNKDKSIEKYIEMIN